MKFFNGLLAIAFGIFAVIDLVNGDYYVGSLEALISLHNFSDLLEAM